MNGYEYEQACAAYLRRKGFRQVEVTQASRDQGADILARRRKEKYAFQCKYYATPVGNKAVQEVYAAATYYGCDHAVVMTNNTFTKGAIELAESLGVELMPQIEPVKRGIGPATILMLSVEVIAVCLLCMVWLEPYAPLLPASFWEENIRPFREGIITSAGLIAAGGLLYFAQWYMVAAILCMCGSYVSWMYLLSIGGWTYAMMAAGAVGALISLLRAIVTTVSRIFKKPEGSEPEDSPTTDMLQEDLIPLDTGNGGEEPDSVEVSDPYPRAGCAEDADAGELSILYDLVGVAERSLYNTHDANERKEILETLEEAYTYLIAHEEELPGEWESPRDRWQQLQSVISQNRGEP